MNTDNQPIQILGRVLNILDAEQGGSENNPWRKRAFIIETLDRFPKKVFINTWGNSIDYLERLRLDDIVCAYVNIESREHAGKYYTEVSAWKVLPDIKRTREAVK